MTAAPETSTPQLVYTQNDKVKAFQSPSLAPNHTSDIIIQEQRTIKGQEGGYSTHEYRLAKFLGKGGSALVYQCTALDTGKDYAIKIVSKRYLAKSKARYASVSRLQGVGMVD